MTIDELALAIEELQGKLAFQDDTIETMEKQIIDQQNQIDVLQTQVVHLNKKIQEGVSSNDQQGDERPPHY